jgi:hypothetical protein
LRRCAPEAFFAPWHPDGALLAERQRWIQTAPGHHLLAAGAAQPALTELATLAAAWTGHHPSPPPIQPPRTPLALTAHLGAMLEPDFVLLSRDPATAPTAAPAPARMSAACVCFPSSWAPEHKLGQTLAEIHSPVPDLNAQLGPALDAWLHRLRPGTAWIRANWGLSASPENNQHPVRGLPRLRPPLDPGATWLRIEHQALLALPDSNAILFGIRLEHRPLVSVRSDPGLAARLAGALRSMPPAMAAYKGIDSIRTAAADWLLGPPHRDRV